MAIFFANLHISTVHTPKSNLSVVKLWPRQLDKNFELQPTSKKIIASSDDRPRPIFLYYEKYMTFSSWELGTIKGCVIEVNY